MTLYQATAALALTIMVGWLLHVGQAILLPLIAALISLYLLSAGAALLGRVPVLGRTPAWFRRLLSLLAFVALIAVLVSLVVSSFASVVEALPRYQANLERIVAGTARVFGLADEPNWERVRALTLERVDLQAVLVRIAGSMGSFGGQVFLIVLYASFLLVERQQFTGKLDLALRDAERSAHAGALLAQMNERVGNYLVVKTAVNAVLGTISLAIMWLIGIEFAVFWAVLIGFLNYIPYVGSLVGVVFPVLLSLAQFGSFGIAALSLGALAAAQVYVGNVLEPRMMSRAFNLSPLVVLVSLSAWTALWGLPGAILAVPMTAVLVIVLAEMRPTRPVAVMLSATGEV